MQFKRRNFIKSGLLGTAGFLFNSPVSALPKFILSDDTNAITISFCETSCTKDEGEKTRDYSNKNVYQSSTGYIPVRIIKELDGFSQIVRGCGENDWAQSTTSNTLITNGPLKASPGLLADINNYITGDQYSLVDAKNGYSMPALALHGANVAAASKATTINFIGHGRGACEAILAAWFLYAYGDDTTKNTPINIFAIDPVPNVDDWCSLLTQLPPNVNNYIGVYAWDELNDSLALVPRPNGKMRGEKNDITLNQQSWTDWLQGKNDWRIMADSNQQQNPLDPDENTPQPQGYKLYVSRGGHNTVAGNTTIDGSFDETKIHPTIAPISELIYKIARGYLTQWGANFTTPCAVETDVLSLRKQIHMFHRELDLMGGGEIRTSTLPNRPYVRRLSSIYGYNPLNSYYMEDIVGEPPYKLAYPITSERQNKGWVDWHFL